VAPTGIVESLLMRAPTSARRVAYLGRHAASFLSAYGRRNPNAKLSSSIREGGFDLLVIEDMRGLQPSLWSGSLAAQGWLIGFCEPGDQLQPELKGEGLSVVSFYPAQVEGGIFDDRSDRLGMSRALDSPSGDCTGIVVAQKASTSCEPQPLSIVAFTPRFLEIRAALPARALRAEPTLTVTFQMAPFMVSRDAVIVLQRPAVKAVTLWRQTMAYAIHLGSIIVIEVDDDPHLTASVQSREATAEDVEFYSYAHAIQTSTPRLADYFRRLNPEVAVFPNAVFELPPLPGLEFTPRVFYGALPRGEFPAEVARSLAPAIVEFPKTEFVVVGDRGVFDALPTDRKVFHDYLPYDRYLESMATCSVLLTPVDGELYAGKSDAKFLEASAHGLLTIASPLCYGSLRHGETGLLAHQRQDWSPRLAEALRAPARSLAIAANAYEWVRSERMFSAQAGFRTAWYQRLFSERDALNAAVMERIDGVAGLVSALRRGDRV
jgi:hypothetical protein